MNDNSIVVCFLGLLSRVGNYVYLIFYEANYQKLSKNFYPDIENTDSYYVFTCYTYVFCNDTSGIFFLNVHYMQEVLKM